MKQHVSLYLMVMVFAATGLMLSCEQAPKGDKAIIAEQARATEGVGESFLVDTVRSWIRFTGHGVGKNHPGIFKLRYGSVMASDNKITGGTFIMDITSLDLEQEGEMIDTKLRPHLLSGDFFDANKFGTSRFQITKIEPYAPRDGEKSLVEGANFRVSGNLQIRDVTKNITFPARVDLDGERLETRANFDIDRREWQMNYGNDKTLGDKFISEKVNIELYLQAYKKRQTRL
jgi:polyisoprenoid-binding protein YceI